MTGNDHRIQGIAAAIEIANLDTDQIMPKQFLHGIDKAGLDAGLLWDLRYTGDGRPRPDFVLNRPEFAGTRVLVGGPNFGCGSSREHAVWGLQQYGIQAVVASAFGEIFYSNAMNNRLLAVLLDEEQVQALMREMRESAVPVTLEIDLLRTTLRSPLHSYAFTIGARHRTMFLDGLDMIGATLALMPDVRAHAERHWAAQPWVRDVAALTARRLGLD